MPHLCAPPCSALVSSNLASSKWGAQIPEPLLISTSKRPSMVQSAQGSGPFSRSESLKADLIFFALLLPTPGCPALPCLHCPSHHFPLHTLFSHFLNIFRCFSCLSMLTHEISDYSKFTNIRGWLHVCASARLHVR